MKDEITSLLAFAFKTLAGDEDKASAACVGLEIGLVLAFEHPEYAQALYQERLSSEGFGDSQLLATKLTKAIPLQSIDGKVVVRDAGQSA